MESVGANLVRAFLVVVVLALPLSGQSTPLPGEFEVEPHPNLGPYQATMKVDITTQGASSPGARISARLAVDSRPSSKGIYFHWQFGTQTTEIDQLVTFESASFQPTAVCARSYTDDRFYVAGWNARLASVVVEEWILSGGQVLGPPVVEGWEKDDRIGVAPAFTVPSFQRNLLFSCDSLSPILDMVVDRHGDALMLLERQGASARKIYSYPLDSVESRCAGLQPGVAGAPSVFLDSVSYPPLLGKSSLWADQSQSSGYIIYASKRKPWEDAGAEELSEGIVTLRDAGNDGVYEELGTAVYSTFFTTHSLWEMESFLESFN